MEFARGIRVSLRIETPHMTPNLITKSFVFALLAASTSTQEPIPVRKPAPKVEIATSKEAADELARALQFLRTLPTFSMKARANVSFEDEQRPDFDFTMMVAAPNQFRVQCADSGLLVCDGKQMLRDWFSKVNAVEEAPKSLEKWLSGDHSPHFFSIVTLRALFGPSGVEPSLLDAKKVSLLGEAKIGDKPALHLAVRDEKLACELWVQKGSEPWLLRYQPKLGHVGEDGLAVRFYAGDIWLEIESWSRDLPKDAFALIAPNKSRRVQDLAEGVMEDQQRHMEEVGQEVGEDEVVVGPTGQEPVPARGNEKPHATVGKPAPEMGWTLLDGTTQKPAELKGKVIVLDFWATWCGPCVKGLPKISAVAKRYEDHGVVFVACNMQEAKGGVEKFLAKRKLEISCAIVGHDFSKVYGVHGIPHTVVVDKDGVIRKVHVGFGPGQERHFEEDLREVLGLPKLEQK